MAQSTLANNRTHHTTLPTGLSHDEVNQRIQLGQVNDYEARVNRSYWDIFRDNVLNLFNIVLFTLLFIVLLLGDYGTVFFAGFSVVSNTFLGMIQEMNAKRRLDNLAALTVQRVHAIRDGEKREIAVREVVIDDILLLEPGTKAVVDGEVLTGDSLEMDEALLTGESDAVLKTSGDPIYSGSFCVAGTGMMRATHIGADSQINRLSEVAKAFKRVRTPTQKRIDIIVELSVVMMLVIVPLLLINNLLVQEPPVPFLYAMRNAVVFVTTLVPQGLVLTAILSLTLGAIKISSQDTLIQKVNAVESLANASVLCFDKTGTLTQNKLAVDELRPTADLNHDDLTQELATYLDNLAHLNRTATALEQYVVQHSTPQNRDKRTEIPFTSGRKWGAVVYDEATWLLGAPERLLTEDDPLHEQITVLTRDGKRVLAFGHMDHEPHTDKPIIGQVQIVALVIMSDQLREDIQETLAALHAENIDLKVISGDNLETVRSIAAQAGMTITGAYTGEQLEQVSDAELSHILREVNVFARIEPATKQRIVRALQQNQEYVAMVGDGVNDVPALKEADLAIVMNDGTQISKDVADIVLLNNAMSTLPNAFREGTEITQTIFGTTKLFMIRGAYLVALYLFVMLMALPFPITPIQISWVTFGTINIPATLIAVGLIRPRLISNFRHDVLDHIVAGGLIGSLALVLLFIGAYFSSDQNADVARAAVTFFVALFNAYIVLMIQGVNFFEPQTFRRYWRAIAMMFGLVTATLWSMYMVPNILEYTPINLAQNGLVFALLVPVFLLSIVATASLLRHRYLMHRMWALLETDDKTFSATVNRLSDQ